MENTNSSLYLDQVKDFTVSQEIFQLYRDTTTDMLYTSPQPSAEHLGKYYESEDYISHTDARRSWFEKAYHLVKRNALQKKVHLLHLLQPQKGSLLDMGCGTGDFLQIAQQAGWLATGIEPNEKAKQAAVSKGVTFVSGTAAVSDHSFDAITLWHVLEHLPNLELQIKELKRILKPNGTILIAVPNFKSYDAAYYKQYWAAYDVPRHLWHFSRTSMQRLFEKQGLTVAEVRPMVFDSFYVSLLSEKYKTGKMNYVSAFFVGLYSNLKASQSKEYSSLIYVIKNQ
jgi:2-polyprenyl-3-methyl-5-hydroxy-6-metoxy-1,4-benzoquinol methylase